MADYQQIIDIAIPRDPNAKNVAALFGYDEVQGKILPLSVISDGPDKYKLVVEAVFGGSITIGAVELKSWDGAVNVKISNDHKMLVYADDSIMQQTNMTAEYTYRASSPGIGKIDTVKEYPTGAAGGAPAKLSTYTYNGDDKVLKIVVSDTTV